MPNIIRRDFLGAPSQLLGIALRPVPEAAMNPLAAVLRRLSVPNHAQRAGALHRRHQRRTVRASP